MKKLLNIISMAVLLLSSCRKESNEPTQLGQ